MGHATSDNPNIAGIDLGPRTSDKTTKLLILNLRPVTTPKLLVQYLGSDTPPPPSYWSRLWDMGIRNSDYSENVGPIPGTIKLGPVTKLQNCQVQIFDYGNIKLLYGNTNLVIQGVDFLCVTYHDKPYK